MLKNILKTNGAQQLSKNELQTINGGDPNKPTNCRFYACPTGYCCAGGRCELDGSPACD